ncbi:hypothetical protein H0H92_002392, partial [Tricholoma furcatifolium]
MLSTITPSGTHNEFPLPLELLREIAGHLDSTEQRNMTLVSRVVRDQILDIAFQRISFTRHSMTKKFHSGKQPRADVKRAVRTFEVEINSTELLIPKKKSGSNIFFRFLQSLPNLKAFIYVQFVDLIPPRELFDSIRHAPLSEFTLYTRGNIIVEGPPTEGIGSLKTFSISWRGTDDRSTPGGSVNHLYHLIQPSLATLAELRIENSWNTGQDFDLRLLAKAGETLRSFDYTTRDFEDKRLGIGRRKG